MNIKNKKWRLLSPLGPNSETLRRLLSLALVNAPGPKLSCDLNKIKRLVNLEKNFVASELNPIRCKSCIEYSLERLTALIFTVLAGIALRTVTLVGVTRQYITTWASVLTLVNEARRFYRLYTRQRKQHQVHTYWSTQQFESYILNFFYSCQATRPINIIKRRPMLSKIRLA